MSEAKIETGSTAVVLSRTDGNENTGLIKLIAMVCMIVDHVGAAFFPRVYEMRLIGRLAFPLFAWSLCVGAEYTRNIRKYALRFLIFGILSQPVYFWAMNHKWYELNVFFELLIGLNAIISVRNNRMGSRYWGPVLSILTTCIINVNSNYGWKGILFILLLYACRKRRTAITGFMIVFCLYWGQGTMQLTQLFGVPLLKEISFLPYAASVLSDLTRIQFWAILALPLIAIPMKRRLLLPRWVPYAVYPAHLLVIGVIRHWNEIRHFISQWV
ncbi:MAG: hypothetical protein IKN04_13865 [Clostridia bacterium]|nr:hypothetical protein [Clostridia bacterium]